MMMQGHFKLDQVARVQFRGHSIRSPSVESQVTVVFAPDDRILIVIIAPENYTKHWLSHFSLQFKIGSNW